jgi:hypothetical protein|tara:strand:- start:3803 stop:4195 length:393 start_codon:yes stop_codon:yes gene_type:complete
MAEQTTQPIPNRRQRRAMLKQQGVLKYLNRLPHFHETRNNFRANNIATGKQIHQNFVDKMEKANEERLEGILENKKIEWNAQGWNSKEIELLEEAWALGAIKDKETYREDKKKAKSLRKEAEALRASRTK